MVGEFVVKKILLGFSSTITKYSVLCDFKYLLVIDSGALYEIAFNELLI